MQGPCGHFLGPGIGRGERGFQQCREGPHHPVEVLGHRSLLVAVAVQQPEAKGADGLDTLQALLKILPGPVEARQGGAEDILVDGQPVAFVHPGLYGLFQHQPALDLAGEASQFRQYPAQVHPGYHLFRPDAADVAMEEGRLARRIDHGMDLLHGEVALGGQAYALVAHHVEQHFEYPDHRGVFDGPEGGRRVHLAPEY